MTVLELEKESKLEHKDIQDISGYIFSFIRFNIDKIDDNTTAIISNFLDSTTDLLEKKLVTDSAISKKEKLEIIHLLTKLKAQKEFIHLVKDVVTDKETTFSDLQKASKRMFKKSQSAFKHD